MNQLDETHTLTRHDHPETSYAAANSVRLCTGTARRRVMQLLADAFANIGYGLSDEEIQEALGMSPNTERPRRVELVRAGYVMDSNCRTTTMSGREAILWVATRAGEQALERDSDEPA